MRLLGVPPPSIAATHRAPTRLRPGTPTAREEPESCGLLSALPLAEPARQGTPAPLDQAGGDGPTLSPAVQDPRGRASEAAKHDGNGAAPSPPGWWPKATDVRDLRVGPSPRIRPGAGGQPRQRCFKYLLAARSATPPNASAKPRGRPRRLPHLGAEIGAVYDQPLPAHARSAPAASARCWEARRMRLGYADEPDSG